MYTVVVGEVCCVCARHLNMSTPMSHRADAYAEPCIALIEMGEEVTDHIQRFRKLFTIISDV